MHCRSGAAHEHNVDIEPFGFRDGLSQPELDWERRQPVRLVETREINIQSGQCRLRSARLEPGAWGVVLGGELAVRTPPKSRRFRLFSRG